MDINTGDESAAAHRSKFVAKEVRAFAPWLPQDDLFAATPPAAAQLPLVSLMVSRRSRRRLPYKMAFLIVPRAFFHAAATEEVCVELPSELRRLGEDMLGLLRHSVYGSRSAAQNWELQ